jgi:hypothetical protein
MSDLTVPAQLRRWAADPSLRAWGETLIPLLVSAADEIEQLQKLAGVVSLGNGSFRNITLGVGRMRPSDPPDDGSPNSGC